MTDYLEEAAQEEVDALLAAERQLSGAPLGKERKAEREEAAERKPVSALESPDRDGEGTEGEESRITGSAREPAESAPLGWRAEETKEAETPEERLPLLAQVERSERETAGGRRGGEPAARGGPALYSSAERADVRAERIGALENGGGPGPGRLSGRRTAFGPGTEALELAEYVDRAFQRDGRRYDSGFFLY